MEELETHSSPPGPGESLSRRMEQRPLVATVQSCLCEIAAGSAAYLSAAKLMLGTFQGGSSIGWSLGTTEQTGRPHGQREAQSQPHPIRPSLCLASGAAP